jgi:hypothetical protein
MPWIINIAIMPIIVPSVGAISLLFNTYFHVSYNLYDLFNSDSLYKCYLFIINMYYTGHNGLNMRNYMS